MSILYAERARQAGDPSLGVWLLDDVLDNTPEAMWGGSREIAYRRMVDDCVDCPRIEIAAFDGKRIVGFVAMVPEEDANVGPCLSLLWNYVTPAYRGSRIGRHFMKRAMHHARALGLPVMSYTHRREAGRFDLVYRRVRNGQES